MSDDRFSAGNASSGSTPPEYFATPAQPSGAFGGPAQSVNPFGATPVQASNPFGAPGAVPPGPPLPFGTPGYGQAPPPGAASKAKPIIVVLVALAVLVGGWFAYRVYEHSRPVSLPATLGGLPVSTLPAVLTAVDSAQKQMQQENPGTRLQFKAYGSDAGRILIAAAARGRTNVDEDIRTFGNDIGASSQVGGSTCATSVADHATVCERSDGDLTVLVASVTRGPATSAAPVSG